MQCICLLSLMCMCHIHMYAVPGRMSGGCLVWQPPPCIGICMGRRPRKLPLYMHILQTCRHRLFRECVVKRSFNVNRGRPRSCILIISMALLICMHRNKHDVRTNPNKANRIAIYTNLGRESTCIWRPGGVAGGSISLTLQRDVGERCKPGCVVQEAPAAFMVFFNVRLQITR